MKKIFFGVFILSIIISCSKGDKTGTLESSDASVSFLSSSESSEVGQGKIEPGQITAAEWNDLNNWNFWSNLMQNKDFSQMPIYWDYNLDGRISVILKNQSTEHIVNQKIELLDVDNQVIWQAKTDNFGEAELWDYQKNETQTSSNKLKIKIGNEIFENIYYYSDGINNITINAIYPNVLNKIDIAFVVDATGSMGDEIEYLKVELISIIEKVKNRNANAQINMGAVFYRDEGDEYLTRKSNFSTDVQQTISFIGNQYAGGGGDFPEAVHSALSVAVNDLQWSSDAKARVIFFILDAPPHYDSQIVSEIHSLICSAAEKGIKIVPVVASGINKETEFLMRYFAIATNGTYVFITNDSGIGNEHLEASVGQYKVEFLNDLLERLVNNYLEIRK